MSTINDAWSALPASGSGHAHAAPIIHRTPEAPEIRMTIAGGPAPQSQAIPDPTDTTVADTFSVIQGAAAAFRRHLDQVHLERVRLTPEGQRQRIAEFKDSAAAKAVDAAATTMQQYRDAKAAEVERIREALSPCGDTASELRATRCWNRHKAVLDSAEGGGVSTAARQAITNADRVELGTLLEELPAYLESRGQPADWLDPLVAQVVPELGDAQRQYRDAERAAQVITYDATTLRKGFISGTVPACLVDPTKIT
ncbi:hypothetical protein [Mycobacterium paraffinicum]|uniref:DUF222 domain-containing protein n=1 Tax=Mycobacterium paraffinicum TaxID=53378 RepID=A0ABP8F258_9MYCO|nr:hypothetical protein [Mycobacterium paraffinicum]MCV7311914.1 hypothetical protein [Mycobacterium paraffinicum]